MKEPTDFQARPIRKGPNSIFWVKFFNFKDKVKYSKLSERREKLGTEDKADPHLWKQEDGRIASRYH